MAAPVSNTSVPISTQSCVPPTWNTLSTTAPIYSWRNVGQMPAGNAQPAQPPTSNSAPIGSTCTTQIIGGTTGGPTTFTSTFSYQSGTNPTCRPDWGLAQTTFRTGRPRHPPIRRKLRVQHHHLHHLLQEYSALAIRTGRLHLVLFYHTRPSRTSRFRRILQPHPRRFWRTLSHQIHFHIIRLFRHSSLVSARTRFMHRYRVHQWRQRPLLVHNMESTHPTIGYTISALRTLRRAAPV